ncbi:DUF4126 family protein [Rufibacter psychrotolerans]|uniref:DUF4126 family protein n=1 Tax=Rufibacter psychrotolerans TaxID=2812556 RepID=UPI0019683CD3|nr:DUF4126 family protein [Rufibacter sp. SYSU D00308]
MALTTSTTKQKALALGAIAGLRAVTAPALVTDHFSKSPTIFLQGTPLQPLQNPTLATVLKILALAELIGDKLPHMPNRIAPLQLVPRAVSGAVVGATLAEAEGESRVTGALLGLVGALTAAYAFFFARQKLGQLTGLPDSLFALLEDALALKGGAAVLRQ